jgi:hypothetical protein
LDSVDATLRHLLSSQCREYSAVEARFPVGFDEPNWGLEHVMAWLAYQNLSRLRFLEVADTDGLERPLWYGRLYQSGLVDAASKTKLRTALIAEKLIGRWGETKISGAWWHENGILNETRRKRRPAWFRRDEVMMLWPKQADTSKVGIESSGGRIAVSAQATVDVATVDVALQAEAEPAYSGDYLGAQVAATISALSSVYPNGHPHVYRKAMKHAVEKEIGRTISLKTLDRARHEKWPEHFAKRGHDDI